MLRVCFAVVFIVLFEFDGDVSVLIDVDKTLNKVFCLLKILNLCVIH